MLFAQLQLRWSRSVLPLVCTICGVAGNVATAAEGPASAPQQAPTAVSGFHDASLTGLVDTKGVVLTRHAYPGKHRLVLFGFTSCADVCPLTLLALREAMKLLGERAEQVVPIFISVDPDRDRPDDLARYVRAFDARIQGLTGTSAVLDRVATGHGVFFEKRWVNVSSNAYVFDHTASVLLIGPDGRLIASVSTVGTTDEVARRIVAAFPKQVR